MRKSLIWTLVIFIGVAVAAISATLASGNSPLLGLDLKGGVSVVLQPQSHGKAVSSSTLQEAVSIIQRRVNGLGVADADVERQGGDVVISLPGIKNSQSALKTLGQTAVLYFRPVYCEIPNYQNPAATTTTTVAKSSKSTPKENTTTTTKAKAISINGSTAALAAATSTTTTLAPANSSGGTPFQPSESDCSISQSNILAALPTTSPDNEVANQSVIVPDLSKDFRYILGPSDATGSIISNTGIQYQNGGWAVILNFTSSGSTKWNQMAAQRCQYDSSTTSDQGVDYRSLEATELDGVVESAPQIQTCSFNGSAQITGPSTDPFSANQANQLALVLRYGSLPIPFTPQSVQTVSATIGKDSLNAGLLAGAGGLLAVMIYMILYYRALGFVVIVGLGVGGALLYSVLTWLSQSHGLALTLSGVTGIIVSIGITVDSYVVYFERLKDEVRSGRTIRSTVEQSFRRAFRTVLTADFVSFLAALILYVETIGDVRGFAFTLGLSTVLDVLTAYFFIRPAVALVGRWPKVTNARWLGVAQGLGGGASSEVPQ